MIHILDLNAYVEILCLFPFKNCKRCPCLTRDYTQIRKTLNGLKMQAWFEACRTHEQHFQMHLHWCGGSWSKTSDSSRPHPLRMTKGSPFWHFSSLPISLHHINEVISCGVAAQSDVGVVDLVLCQDRLHCITIQFSLCTLKREENKEQVLCHSTYDCNTY